ncbi:MAG: hypothetical protein ACREJU_03960 [Nitrospiraceae bacterium]
MRTPLRVTVLAFLVLADCSFAVAQAADLGGTWRGVLAGGEESANVEVEFSEAGYPIYSYTNNQGVARQVELTTTGQKVEYVPAGGGVQRVIVESIVKQPGRVALSLAGSFEKASQGYLDQQQETTMIEYVLVPQGLKMRVTSRSASHFGDKDMMVRGNPNESVAEGILQKVR